MGHARTVIEGWPALMSLEMAARYLSMEEAQFTRATTRFNAHPVEIEDGLLRWRKSDLDLLIKRLETIPGFAFTAGVTRLGRLDDADVDRIVNAVADKLTGASPSMQRSLISIKEAGIMLGLGRSTIYKLINEGRLSTRRIGSRTLIPSSEIQAFLDGDAPPE